MCGLGHHLVFAKSTTFAHSRKRLYCNKCNYMERFYYSLILLFPLAISVLEKDHPTRSKICCCIPRFRTPVCVLSVLVKSAVELQQRSALLGKHSTLPIIAYYLLETVEKIGNWGNAGISMRKASFTIFSVSLIKIVASVGLVTHYLTK